MWQQMAPRNAELLYARLDYQTKKAIYDEQEKFQLEGMQEDEGMVQEVDEGMHQLSQNSGSRHANSVYEKRNQDFLAPNTHTRSSQPVQKAGTQGSQAHLTPGDGKYVRNQERNPSAKSGMTRQNVSRGRVNQGPSQGISQNK